MKFVQDSTIEKLKNYHNNLRIPFLLCYPAKAFLNSDIGLKNLERFVIEFDNQKVFYNTIYQTLQNKSKLEECLKGFEAVFLKAIISDSLASLRNYCEKTNQIEKLKNKSWYEFFRMVRNAFSHDNTWNFDTYYESILPVTYHGQTITIQMQNQLMRYEFFNAHIAWHLLEDVENFINTELN